MSGDTTENFKILSLIDAERVDAACDRFETAWRSGEWPCIEAYLDSVVEPARTILLHELLKLEVELRRGVGEHPAAQEYRVRFPEHASAIHELFERERIEEQGETTCAYRPAPSDPLLDSHIGSTSGAPESQVRDCAGADVALGRVLGDYVLLDKIGSGAMGVVYRALQRSTRRIVALKLIRADWRGGDTEASNREARLRFTNEAHAHAQLEHDHIVPLYDAGHSGGLLYFSMRLIKGRSLRQIVRSEGPLAPRRAAYYVEAVARAIQYAHDRNILHRDLKPGNILVDGNDRPYLIDLGLAKSLEATEYTTLSGHPLGTPEFMSPEQARGQKDVGFASDVYGLGATLFALLTGRPPFGKGGEPPLVILRKAIDEEAVWPRERNKPVGRELKAICLKCLEKDPLRRFSTAGDLAVALNKYLNYEHTGITFPGPQARLAKWIKRKPWRAAAAGIALLAALGLGLGWATVARHRRAAAATLVHDIQVVPLALLPSTLEHAAPYHDAVSPPLRELLRRDPSNAELRSRIAMALVSADPSWTKDLIDRLLSCDPEEHRVIREVLRGNWQQVSPVLLAVLTSPSQDQRKRTRAAAALVASDGGNDFADRAAWLEFRQADDPGPRVELLEWLVRSKARSDLLIVHFERERDPAIRRLILQCLGELGTEHASPAGASFLSRLDDVYRNDPDPGVHSSAAYVFWHWGYHKRLKQMDRALAGVPRGSKRWFVNPHGQTMAVIGDDLNPGSLSSERFPYRFSIATTETTLEQYQKFEPGHDARRKKYGDVSQGSPELPADFVSYNDAAMYCNWLSQREGLPPEEWCYVRGDERLEWALAPNYLARRGYRLPDLREWEYAARAGTKTTRYFGESLDHADQYAWYDRNTSYKSEPVARKRPNDYGLFDVLGNVTEWCYNPDPPHDPECHCSAPRGENCVKVRFVSLRGGCFYYTTGELAARPNHSLLDQRTPSERYNFTGFRIARIER
jgi:serine/threonine-protein kinase